MGADIAAGMLACGMDEEERPSLLLDLGTNGEMVLALEDKMIATSAPAGPALEGGNISCGGCQCDWSNQQGACHWRADNYWNDWKHTGNGNLWNRRVRAGSRTL